MVLSSFRQRLSIGNNSKRKHDTRRRRKSYHHSRHYRKAGLYVDIGENEPLHVEIDSANSYDIIHDSDSSVCVHISYENAEDEILLVKWGDNLRDVNSRDHIAAKAANGIVEVPVYKSKDLITYCGKHVSISRRSYIKGQTLKSVYSSLDDEDIDAIFMQVQAIIWQLATKTSDYFGHIQDGELKTSSPAAYLRTRVLLDRLKNRINEFDWEEQGKDNYVCKAVMCHGDLSPEHIILNGSTVVGLIGWSKGDFVSEILDRLQYYFRSEPNNPRCWYRKLSEIGSGVDSKRPSVEFVFNATTYLYKSMWSNSSPDRRRALTRLWKSITMNYTQVPCISTAVEIESDNMSLSTLTSWWESSVGTITNI